MSAYAHEIDGGLPPRLAHRIRSIGVPVVCLRPDGRMRGCVRLSDLAQMLADSPLLQAAVRQAWPQLCARSGDVMELIPGVRVAPLPPSQRRRRMTDRFQVDVLAVLLLGPELLRGENITRLCNSVNVPVRQALLRIDPTRLVSADEAARLAALFAWMQEDAVEIDRRLLELRTLSGELSDSYEELSLLYKLSTSMRVSRAPDAFLADAVHELHEVTGLRWLALQLTKAEPRLEPWSGLVVVSGDAGTNRGAIAAIGQHLMDRANPQGEPMVCDDTSALDVPGLSAAAHSLLAVPVRNDQQMLGILFGGDKIDGSHISSGDAKLCDSLASSLSIFLENAMLYDDMQAMFLGTLHALTSAIDAKDSYTHGHSERVALLSRMIASAAGAEPAVVERIYVSGLVHDVGKIGVPEAVLCKNGRLTDEEFDLIRLHPQIGAHILEDIRQMQDLVPGVLYHHERWDGSGYPHGLAGEQIPFMGRVIALADAFDAMSSNRTYRSAMELQEVLEEIRRCRGTQFDPQLVDVFLSLGFEPFFELVAQHQGQREHKKAG